MYISGVAFWIYSKLFQIYRSQEKIGLSSVGKMYIVCAILQNTLTCLYKNQTSLYFDIEPPTLQEYFN